MENLAHYAENKIKVRVTFQSGKVKWGWIHLYDNRYWLTRGNRVGFSMDTATKVEEMKSGKVSA
jgi:hypothetical protein